MGKDFLEDRIAFIGWGVFLGIIFLNLVGTVLAPLLKIWGIEALSRLLYGFYHLTCHQLPSRSWFICGEKLGVCVRCFATYLFFVPAGLLVFITQIRIWILRRSFVKFIVPVSFLFNLPMIVDGLFQLLTSWESTHLLRLITGGLSSLGLVLFLGAVFLKVTNQADQSVV
ncbi:DUF2085 domain-containing protein [candidate division WOR-3 bacterium]|nr:DUF2085 domain-containing protein [candidate division WOR-3 bacterium]